MDFRAIEMSHLPGLPCQSPESSSTSPELFSTLDYEYSARELPGKRKGVLIVTEQIKFSTLLYAKGRGDCASNAYHSPVLGMAREKRSNIGRNVNIWECCCGT